MFISELELEVNRRAPMKLWMRSDTWLQDAAATELIHAAIAQISEAGTGYFFARAKK